MEKQTKERDRCTSTHGWRRVRVWLAVAVTSVAVSACSSGSGGFGAFSYGGTWSGTIQDSVAGNGTIRVALTQAGTTLVGTWSASFVGSDNGGSLVGLVNGDQVVLELNPSNVYACPYDVVATRSGSTMAGTYAAFDCTGTITGRLTVAKE